MSVTSIASIDKGEMEKITEETIGRLHAELSSSGYTHLLPALASSYRRMAEVFTVPPYAFVKSGGERFFALAVAAGLAEFRKVTRTATRKLKQEEANACPTFIYVCEERGNGKVAEGLPGGTEEGAISDYPYMPDEWPVTADAFFGLVVHYFQIGYKLQSVDHDCPSEDFPYIGLADLFKGRPITHLVFNGGLTVAHVFVDKKVLHEDLERYEAKRSEYYEREMNAT